MRSAGSPATDPANVVGVVQACRLHRQRARFALRQHRRPSLGVRIRIRTRLALVVAALAVVVTPALLFAHARLVRSTPAANTQLTTSPTALNLWFSEHPELRFSTVELFDSAGTAIGLGTLAAMPGDGMGLSVPIPQPLGDGRYTVVWHTAAADGHATAGRFSFSVTAANAPAVPPVSPSVLASSPTQSSAPNSVVAPSATPNLSTALRWAELVAVLAIIGTMIFRLFVLPEAKLPAPLAADSADRARRLAQAALLLFVIATLTRVIGQSDLIPNAANARLAAVMTVMQDTRWGRGWLIGAFGAVMAGVGLIIARRAYAGWIVASLGAVAICLGESYTGHAGAMTRHPSVSIAADLAHVLGAGGWVGGLATVLLAGLPALRSLEASERAHAGSRLVRAYHRAAVECVLLTVLAALVAVWLRFDTLDALWTTLYGRILLIKIALVAGLLGFGWHHYRTAVRPEWSDDTRPEFVRSAAVELLLGAFVVAVTALLISTAMPGSGPS